MIKLLSNFFLKEEYYFNISVVRVLFYVFLFFKVNSFVGFAHYLQFPEEMMRQNGFFQVYAMKDIVLENLSLLKIAFHLSVFFSAIGLFTTTSNVVAFLIAFLFFSIPRAFHSNLYLFIPISSVMFFMCFSSCGDHFSVDSLIFKDNLKRERKREYGWAIRMVQILFVHFFFMSGFLKLYKTGSAWFLSDTLVNNFLCSPFLRADFAPASVTSLSINYYLSQFPTFFKFAAFVSIVTELLAPLMLFSRTWKKLLLTYFAFFQFVALLSLFIDASINIPLYFFWIDWHSIYLFMKRKMKHFRNS